MWIKYFSLFIKGSIETELSEPPKTLSIIIHHKKAKVFDVSKLSVKLNTGVNVNFNM